MGIIYGDPIIIGSASFVDSAENPYKRVVSTVMPDFTIVTITDARLNTDSE